MKNMLLLCVVLVLAACGTSKNDFYDKYTGVVPGTYATYAKSYSDEGMQEAAVLFDTAVMLESGELGMEKALSRGTPFTESATFEVMKYYRYNIYIRMYGEYIKAKKCQYTDQDTKNLVTLMPAIKKVMHDTIATYIITPLEKDIEKDATSERMQCEDRPLTKGHDGKPLTNQAIWAAKALRLAKVMQRSKAPKQ